MADGELSWEFDVEVLRLRRGRAELVLSAGELAALVELAEAQPAFVRALSARAQGWVVVSTGEQGERVWLSHGPLGWLPHTLRAKVWPLVPDGQAGAEGAARLAEQRGRKAQAVRYYGG